MGAQASPDERYLDRLLHRYGPKRWADPRKSRRPRGLVAPRLLRARISGDGRKARFRIKDAAGHVLEEVSLTRLYAQVMLLNVRLSPSQSHRALEHHLVAWYLSASVGTSSLVEAIMVVKTTRAVSPGSRCTRRRRLTTGSRTAPAVFDKGFPSSMRCRRTKRSLPDPENWHDWIHTANPRQSLRPPRPHALPKGWGPPVSAGGAHRCRPGHLFHSMSVCTNRNWKKQGARDRPPESPKRFGIGRDFDVSRENPGIF